MLSDSNFSRVLPTPSLAFGREVSGERGTRVARDQTGRNLAAVAWRADTEGVQAAEVGRSFSGVCKTDGERGPKLRAPNSGYSVGHHPQALT
jgi:hypothetical protein